MKMTKKQKAVREISRRKDSHFKNRSRVYLESKRNRVRLMNSNKKILQRGRRSKLQREFIVGRPEGQGVSSQKKG